MDPAKLASEMGQFQVVDVRYRNEWEAGHIDGAVHIPADYVLDRVGELDPSRPVVTVCGVPGPDVGRSSSYSSYAAATT
jgi:rhodanese-related sulfurtransferase